MSSNEYDRILEAIDILCNIPKHTLESLRAQLPSAFLKLQTLVGLPQDRNMILSSTKIQDSSNFPIYTSAVSNTSQISSTPPDSASIHLHSSPSSTDDRPLPKSISNLMKALNKDSVQIKKFLSASGLEHTRDELERLIEDPRVVDLQLDKHLQSDSLKFRKGLSQRSLATEYVQWEDCTYRSSRVSELAKDLSTAQETHAGHIQEYLDLNSHRFINKEVTRAGLKHGIKLLVLERLLGQRAISAILSFKYTLFRAVKYEDLNSLVRGIDQIRWILELVEKKADWFDSCQNQYNTWCSEMSRKKSPHKPSLEPSRKRCRLAQPVTHHQYMSQRGDQTSTTVMERGNSSGKAEQSQPATANPPPLPNASSMHQSNLTAINAKNTAYPYDSAVTAQAISLLPPQETLGDSYDLTTLARDDLPCLPYKNTAYPYDSAVSQAISLPPPQETLGDSYNLITLARDELPSLPYENSTYPYDSAVSTHVNPLPPPQETLGNSYDLLASQSLHRLPPHDFHFRFGVPKASDPFAVSPQPLFLHV